MRGAAGNSGPYRDSLSLVIGVKAESHRHPSRMPILYADAKFSPGSVAERLNCYPLLSPQTQSTGRASGTQPKTDSDPRPVPRRRNWTCPHWRLREKVLGSTGRIEFAASSSPVQFHPIVTWRGDSEALLLACGIKPPPHANPVSRSSKRIIRFQL